MNRIAYILTILIAVLAYSCRSGGIAIAKQEITTDTIVSVRYEKIQTIDTVYVQLPQQMAQNHSLDSVSHLETDYAESTARINADGSLYHDLNTKKNKVALPSQKIEETKDSIAYVSNIVYVEVPKIVEKELTWWQKIRMHGFTAIIILFAIWLVLRYGWKITGY